MLRCDLLVNSPVYLIGLVKVLRDAGISVVSTRTSPKQELSWIADAAVLDADSLPERDELECVADVARRAPVLVLVHESSRPASDYLRAGANGVIRLAESVEKLVEALRTVATGAHLVPRAKAAVPAVEPVGQEAPSSPSLSEREEQVLNQISHGLTHGQIANRLSISPHTVDTYVKRIRAKLGVGNKAELTRVALIISMAEPAPELAPTAPLQALAPRVV